MIKEAFKEKNKVFLRILIISILHTISFIAFASSGDGCDGCDRTAVLKKITGIEKDSFMSHLVEHSTSPCFHLQNLAAVKKFGGGTNWKSAEYYFTASYETNLEGRIKSRLSINLYFEDGELIHQWKTESERPTFTFSGHLRRMFKNRDAVFKEWVPLDITLLNDFEKQPDKCDIHPDKEELFRGQETKVKISNIVDFEGRNSREFNRIVVQAMNGEIIGGTPLASDPKLKAFQVGNDDITFTYVAPDEESSQATEDKIIVYNSCDILREDEFSMSKTGFKNKIAEETIKMVKDDAEATLRAKCHSADSNLSIDWEFTFKATFQYHDTIAEENTFTENFDVKSYSLSDVNATIIDKSDGSKVETHQGEIDDMHPPDVMWIEFDRKTGKAKEVNLPGLGFNLIFNGSKMLQTFGNAFPGMSDVKRGDGVHELGGGGTYSINAVTFSCNWSVQRHRRE
jgi:hypothetical protein